MWTVSSNKNDRMGLGWFIDNLKNGKLVSHPGGGLGYCSEFCLFPEQNLAVIVLCNSRRGPAWKIVSAIAFKLMKEKEASEITASIELDILNNIKTNGIDEGVQYYKKLRKEISSDNFSPMQLLILGHRVLIGNHKNKFQLAEKIFRLNLEYFPDFAYAYDMLAEVYLKMAQKFYQKAVKLDPTIWGAKEILKRIDPNYIEKK